MRNLVLSLFLITSSVFAESCKKYESEIDSYLLCYKEVLYSIPFIKYFFNESKIVNAFGRVYEKSSYSLVVDKNGKPRTCKCLPYDQMHID